MPPFWRAAMMVLHRFADDVGADMTQMMVKVALPGPARLPPSATGAPVGMTKALRMCASAWELEERTGTLSATAARLLEPTSSWCDVVAVRNQ